MPRILTSSNKVGAVSDKLRLFEGGTDATTGAAALVKLNAVPYSSINQASGVAGLDAQGKVNLAMLDITTGLGAVTVEGPSTVYTVGSTFTITNYDSFKNYTLTATNGTVTRVGSTITFMPTTTSGQGSFTISGKVVNFTIVVGGINRPTILTPANNDTGVTLDTYSMMASTFSTTGVVDTIESSDWQLSTSANFTTLVASVAGKLTDRNNWSVSALSASTKYYVRMRYKGQAYSYSEWSPVAAFTTRAAYPAYGVLASSTCDGTTKVLTYHNGVGDFYVTNVTNSTDCNYVPPVVHPAYGTILGYYCVNPNRWATYANGSGGTYTSVYEYNVAACGYVAPPVYPVAGTVVSTYCDGYTAMVNLANGSGGTSPAVGRPNYAAYFSVGSCAPPYGTFLSKYCDPRYGSSEAIIAQYATAQTSVYADGNNGTYEQTNFQSTECGYVAPPASGTLLSSYCYNNPNGNGDPFWSATNGNYADGVGGTYVQAIRLWNYPDCTDNPPAGTVLRAYCGSGLNKMEYREIADGSGGFTTQPQGFQEGVCGYTNN